MPFNQRKTTLYVGILLSGSLENQLAHRGRYHGLGSGAEGLEEENGDLLQLSIVLYTYHIPFADLAYVAHSVFFEQLKIPHYVLIL